MADQVSDTPDIVEDQNATPLVEEHTRATEATKPLEKPADDFIGPPAPPSNTTESFKDAAEKEHLEINIDELTPEQRMDGFIRKKDNTKLHFGMPMGDTGDMFSALMYLLGLLFKDPEMFPFMAEMMFPEKIYTDPVERQERIEYAKEIAVNKDHPDRDLPAKEMVEKIFGAEHFQNLKPHISNLMNAVTKAESGKDANIVYNYTGGTGFQPGDTTPKGLKIPNMEELTVNQVIEWQDKYKAEQRAYFEENNIHNADGSRKYPSSAAGAYQFTGNRLEQLRDNGYIDGDMKFDVAGQQHAASQSVKQLIDHAVEHSNGTFSDIRKRLDTNLQREWIVLQGSELKDVLNTALNEIAKDSNPTAIMTPSSP